MKREAKELVIIAKQLVASENYKLVVMSALDIAEKVPFNKLTVIMKGEKGKINDEIKRMKVKRVNHLVGPLDLNDDDETWIDSRRDAIYVVRKV